MGSRWAGKWRRTELLSLEVCLSRALASKFVEDPFFILMFFLGAFASVFT